MPLYAILNGMENLRFDKEGYFHVLVFYELFYKRNRKRDACANSIHPTSRKKIGFELAFTLLPLIPYVIYMR